MEMEMEMATMMAKMMAITVFNCRQWQMGSFGRLREPFSNRLCSPLEWGRLKIRLVIIFIPNNHHPHAGLQNHDVCPSHNDNLCQYYSQQYSQKLWFSILTKNHEFLFCPGQLPSNCPPALKLPRKHPLKNQVYFCSLFFWHIFDIYLCLYSDEDLLSQEKAFWKWCSGTLKMFHPLTLQTQSWSKHAERKPKASIFQLKQV